MVGKEEFKSIMEVANYNTIELLKVHDIKASKSMGQNFLIDPNIPKKIVKSIGLDESQGVFEIGPGLGALTLELSSVAGHVVAVELDKHLVGILGNIFGEHENVDIVQGDALKVDIGKLVDEKLSGRKLHVCANLPYNITTPVITRLLELGLFESLTVMIQKEVAERICAKAGSAEYGSFTVFANYYTQPEMLFDVSPDCFYPRPKVTSTVIRLKTKAERGLSAEKEKMFFKVVKAAFGQRRKTLVNALHAVFGNSYGKEEIATIVSNCGYDTRIRGERLNLEEFMALAEHFGAK